MLASHAFQRLPSSGQALAKDATMINGAHVLLYSPDAAATRDFIRGVLGFAHVDSGDGWLIFALPPGELGVHPAAKADGEFRSTHELYLMCDDIEATVANLRGKGVEFTTGISDEGWGILTTIKVPGGGELGLYEPRHAVAKDLR
jgi:catechol 2,3-dioxygenase-like lactoylglutathione lyase family enzyme